MTNGDGGGSNYVSNRDLARKIDLLSGEISGIAVSIGRFSEWRLAVNRRLGVLEKGSGSNLKETVDLVLGWVFRLGLLLILGWGLVEAENIAKLLP